MCWNFYLPASVSLTFEGVQIGRGKTHVLIFKNLFSTQFKARTSFGFSRAVGGILLADVYLQHFQQGIVNILTGQVTVDFIGAIPFYPPVFKLLEVFQESCILSWGKCKLLRDLNLNAHLCLVFFLNNGAWKTIEIWLIWWLGAWIAVRYERQPVFRECWSSLCSFELES